MYDPYLGKVTEIDGPQTASYTYGADNEQAMMEVGTGSSPDRTIYMRGLSDYPLVEMTNSGSSPYTAKKYVYGPTGLLAIHQGQEDYVYFPLKDNLGSTRVLLETKPDGSSREVNPKAAYGYLPYGEEMLMLSAMETPYLYTGQEYEEATDLYNYRARHYAHRRAHFLAPDPQGQFHSPYVYAGNNPVSFVDPDGEFAWFAPIIIGAAMNVGAQAISGNIDNFWEGLGYAAVGGFGGAMSMVGNPGAWYGFQNVLTGSLQGGLTQGFNNAVAGDRFLNDVGKGAAIGGAFGLVTSEQFKNTIKGQNWRSNQQVLDQFTEAGEYQKALDYFGGNGVYDPDNPQFKDGFGLGGTDPKTGEISYHTDAFSSYDKLESTILHENIHRKNVLSGMYDEYDKIPFMVRGKEELSTYMFSYKNQGLYHTSGISYVTNITAYGYMAGKTTEFQPKWWHFIYKVPRRYGIFK